MQDPRDAEPDFTRRELEIASPYRNKVVSVDLADEPSWGKDKVTTRALLIRVRNPISKAGLTQKLLGITYYTDGGTSEEPPWRQTVQLPELGVVNLECYLPLTPPEVKGSVNQMVANVLRHRKFLRANMPVWRTMQGYTRNRSLTASQALPAQDACYKLALGSPRTLGMTIFSHGGAS